MKMRRWSGTWLLLLACVLLPLPARALGPDAVNTGFIIDFNEQWLREDAVNRTLSQARKDMQPRERHQAGGGSDVKTDILWTGSLRLHEGRLFLNDEGVHKLANMFPSQQYVQAYDAFTQIIASFNENVERLYKVPPENVATGVAALLAGGYAAYHNKPFPDAWVRPVVRQVDALLRQKPELFEGKTVYKRESYQVSVGIGMLLLMTQTELAKQKGADASALKAAGAQVLASTLGAPPERIVFSASGFRVR